jgi:energy-coupling factor transport system permease protein
MDARAFGAHPDRTERHLVPWRARDTVFVVTFWLVSGAILIALFPWPRRRQLTARGASATQRA